MSKRDAISADRAVRQRLPRRRRRPRDLLRAIGQPARQAGAVRARRSGRRRRRQCAAILRSRRATVSSCSISAVPGAAGRTLRSKPIRPGISSPTWSACAAISAIERWLVFGGSWGSTLALAYAQTHPTAVSELVLRGIFLLRQARARLVLSVRREPAVSRAMAEVSQRRFRPRSATTLLGAFHRRLLSDDEAVRLEAARAWSVWEGATSSLLPNPKREDAVRLAGIRAGARAHRGPLFRQSRLLLAREPAARRRRQDSRDPGRHRAWAL